MRGQRTVETIVFLSAVAGSALLSLSLGQDVCWDQYNYHYYTGYAFLTNRLGYDFAPAQVQSFFNPLLHVPTYLMQRYLSSRAVALILGAIQGLNFWLIYKISKELFSALRGIASEILCLAIAVTAFYGAANIAEVGTSMGDNLVSILLLAAILLIIRHLSTSTRAGRREGYRVAAAGCLGGLAVGLKLTAAVFVVPMAVSLVVVALVSRMRLKPVALLIACMLFGFMVSYGFWGVTLYRQYGSPCFPFLNQVFHSQYYGNEDARDSRFFPRDWQQSLFYPFYLARENTLASENPFRDLRFAVCYVMVLLLTARYCRDLISRAGPQRSRDPADWNSQPLAFMTLFVTFSYILWQNAFSIYRYALLLDLLAPVFLSIAVFSLIRLRWLSYAIVFLTLSVISWYEIPLDFDREPYLEGRLQVRPPAWDHLEDSVVLMGGIEGYAYIIPSFPRSTRFVRIDSTLTSPGKNPPLDRKIQSILNLYSRERTLVYLHSLAELKTLAPVFRSFGAYIDAPSCAEVTSVSGNAGYLCRTKQPTLNIRHDVTLEVTPKAAYAGKDTLLFKVVNLDARAIDLLYTVDGREMPPVRNWVLDSLHTARVFVGPSTPKGLYHIVGIRDSDSLGKEEWEQVDVSVRIK